MDIGKLGLAGWFTRFASGLRFPGLLLLFVVVLVVNILIPDPLPFVDELLLALGTLLLARLRKPALKEEEKTSLPG